MSAQNGEPLPAWQQPERPEGYITMTEMVVEMCRLLESVPEVSAAAKELSDRTERTRKYLIELRSHGIDA